MATYRISEDEIEYRRELLATPRNLIAAIMAVLYFGFANIDIATLTGLQRFAYQASVVGLFLSFCVLALVYATRQMFLTRMLYHRARGREEIERGFMLLPAAIYSRFERPVQERIRRVLIALLLLLAGLSITGSLAVFSSKLLGVGAAS